MTRHAKLRTLLKSLTQSVAVAFLMFFTGLVPVLRTWTSETYLGVDLVARRS